EMLAGIWSAVLQRERVGVEDNFFALGGHSLLATQVMSRVRKAFGIEMPLRALFEAPTVAGLAREIETALAGRRGRREPPPPLVRRPREGALSFAQERLWFLDQLDPASAAYNLPAAWRLTGGLAPGLLDASLQCR